MIELPNNFEPDQTPYVVASQKEDYLYITAWSYNSVNNPNDAGRYIPG